ncbi:ribosomal RNA processing protein 1 homolog B isoform X2 [Rhineura floridana]|uniref:ribosomal RNA processing protein 1 homolog B isoform X2 n=1 Tax=Rhineura floridana TaxID=261503 RepID=UPI002AC819C6|nr:ribosomal RNA processing protein 1 homolog B isoform X2 [Rhineura floridana]
MAPATAASAVQPPEIQFAQRLAANEKRIRDRALKKLRGYITLRTQSVASSFSQEELLKIWKGLFYCMWMQDKPLLQEELSNNISQLIHVIENMDARHLFIQTFWQTMSREWNGIDRLRLDKFYMLMRMVLRQSFEVLKRNGWNESFTEPFLNMLMKEVLHPDSKAPNGIKLHFIDIFLEELAKVGAKELTADQNLKFIEPFCKIGGKTPDHFLLQAIIHGIFETIVDQSPFAIEDLMKEMKAGSDNGLSEEDEWNDDENKPIVKDKGLPSKFSLGLEDPDNLLEGADDNIGPVLQFDYKAVGDTLFELASRKNTPAFNRKHLYKVVKKFHDLAEGTFPQDDFPEDVSTDEDDDTFSRRKWKRKSGKPVHEPKLEKEECTGNRKNGTEEEEGNRRPQKKRKKQKRKSSQMVDSGTAAELNEKGLVHEEGSKESNQDCESLNSKKRPKKSLSTEANEIGSSSTPSGGPGGNFALKTLTCLVNSIKKQPKKKKGSLQNTAIETIRQNGQANISTEEDPSHCVTIGRDSKGIKKKRKAEPVMISGSVFCAEAVEQPKKESLAESECIVLQKVKLKKKQKLGDLVKIRGSKQKMINLKKKKKIKKVLNSVEENETQVENKKSNNNETGGAAVLLRNKKAKIGNDFVKFEKTTLPKPAFFRKAKGSITALQLSKLQSSNSKKVTFGLNKNMTAEFKTTDKSILVSPEGASRVAFNPEQKPSHGVLKSPSTSSAEITPQIKKPFSMPTKKRPTAMDFF